MSAVSEWIAREYFESLGFLVRQPRKYQVSARPKHAEEEVDLLVVNPASPEHTLSSHIIWGAAEVRKIQRGIVAVRGWHTERFTPSVIALSPEIFRFAGPAAQKNIGNEFGPGPIAKILCLPGLPASEPLRKKAVDLFREKGVDGVILFRTMLMELAQHVDVNRNYDKSDLLQLLRILKNYDLLKDAQMELFKRKRARSSPRKPKPGAEAPSE